MNRKKETILLFLIIFALSAYLFVQKKGKTHYSLPQLEKIQKEDISKLTIKKGSSETTLLRESDQWMILPEKFPANNDLVNDMVDGVSKLTLTALASESKNYFIYELDEENKVEVEAYEGDQSIRKIELGKTASSHRHTFVKLGDDYRVFHAQGNLINAFKKTVADLRDKTVIRFEDDITEISFTEKDKTMVIVKLPAPVSLNLKEQPEEAEEKGKENKELAVKWLTDQGEPVKEDELEKMVNTLSKLECDGFIEDKTKKDLTDPVYIISLKGIKTYSLSLFEKKDSKYMATSSENEYPFWLAEWKAKKIMKDL